MNTKLHAQLIAAGCKPASPAFAQEVLRKFGKVASKPLCDLFCTMNGGSLKRLNSRFISLRGAARIWDISFSEMEWRFFPVFFDIEHESDPVVIGLDGPLQGFVIHTHHSDKWRVLAPNLASFLRALKDLPDEKRFFVEGHKFVYPRKLSESDGIAAKGLIDLSYTSKAKWMERTTFTELALSMVCDEELLKVLRLEPHPDSNSRSLIQRRLSAVPGAAAKKALSRICPK